MSIRGDGLMAERPLFQAEGGGSIPTSPLQLDIRGTKKVSDIKRICELNAVWHSRLPKIDYSNVIRNKNYICYQATYEGNIFAVAI